MITIPRTAVVLTVLFGLTACGGGSSSGAGSQGGPAPTAFAGTYRGEFSVTVYSRTVAEPVTITVAPNGYVGVTAQGPSAPCVLTASGTPYLAGNHVATSGTGQCYASGLGTCKVSYQADLTFSGNSAVGQGTETLVCPTGSVTAKLGLGAKKVS